MIGEFEWYTIYTILNSIQFGIQWQISNGKFPMVNLQNGNFPIEFTGNSIPSSTLQLRQAQRGAAAAAGRAAAPGP